MKEFQTRSVASVVLDDGRDRRVLRRRRSFQTLSPRFNVYFVHENVPAARDFTRLAVVNVIDIREDVPLLKRFALLYRKAGERPRFL